MDAKHFSFSELEKKIAAIPEGPVAALNRPRWQYWLDIGGGVGVIVGLLPSLLSQFLALESWMITMTNVGFWMMVILFLPGFARSTGVIALSIWRGRSEDNAQADHDFAEFDRLQAWLAKFPKQTLEQHLRFIQTMQARLLAKLSLIGGGFERFGILPLILAISVQMKAFTADSLDLPIWQIVPGLFLAIGYLVGLRASFTRVRMHLYEVVLAEAIERRGK